LEGGGCNRILFLLNSKIPLSFSLCNFFLLFLYDDDDDDDDDKFFSILISFKSIVLGKYQYQYQYNVSHLSIPFSGFWICYHFLILGATILNSLFIILSFNSATLLSVPYNFFFIFSSSFFFFRYYSLFYSYSYITWFMNTEWCNSITKFWFFVWLASSEGGFFFFFQSLFGYVILSELILVKIQLKMKCFMFGYIDLKTSLTNNLSSS